MGVKNFTKVFPLLDKNKVQLSDYKNKIVAVDAMVEVYRSLLGIGTRQMLTDKKGRPTIHIGVILCLILELYKNNIGQIWCFDSYNAAKKDELEYRKKEKEKAAEKIEEIENDPDLDFLNENEDHMKKIDNLKKRSFTVENWMVDDVKFILDCFGIKYLDSENSYESEHLAACMTQMGIADAVLTTDADALLFGAKEIIKRDTRRTNKGTKKKYYKYNLADLLKTYKLSQIDLVKVGICLGNDFIQKGIPRIGPKTVLKKFDAVDEYLAMADEKFEGEMPLQMQVKRAYSEFTKKCPRPEISENLFIDISIDSDKMQQLLNWLGTEKNYNVEIRKKLILRAIKYKNKKQ